MKKIDCQHWRDEGAKDWGRCAIGKFGGRPSKGTCRECLKQPAYTRQIRGLGDFTEMLIHRYVQPAMLKLRGKKVKHCGGCQKRQDALNRIGRNS